MNKLHKVISKDETTKTEGDVEDEWKESHRDVERVEIDVSHELVSEEGKHTL